MKEMNGGEWNLDGETTVMWNQMVDYSRRVAKDVLGNWKRKRNFFKET